jgi:hypothetical protein
VGTCLLPMVLVLLAIALGGCSDSAAPAAGMFRAQLSGARVATLSGASNAETIFSEESPGPQYAIRMFAERGDTVQALVLRCPGDQPPLPGDYPLDSSGEGCPGAYSRVVSNLEDGTIVLERAAASSGGLTIRESQPGQTAGVFEFRGILVVEADSVGTLQATGTFSADQL